MQGVGIVVAIGAHTQDKTIKLGDRVGVKWLANSCLDCEHCRNGLGQGMCIYVSPVLSVLCLLSCVLVCGKGEYSGFTVDGTFSEYVKSYIRHVSPIPEGLSSQDAASILCAVSLDANTTRSRI